MAPLLISAGRPVESTPGTGETEEAGARPAPPWIPGSLPNRTSS